METPCVIFLLFAVVIVGDSSSLVLLLFIFLSPLVLHYRCCCFGCCCFYCCCCCCPSSASRMLSSKLPVCQWSFASPVCWSMVRLVNIICWNIRRTIQWNLQNHQTIFSELFSGYSMIFVKSSPDHLRWCPFFALSSNCPPIRTTSPLSPWSLNVQPSIRIWLHSSSDSLQLFGIVQPSW